MTTSIPVSGKLTSPTTWASKDSIAKEKKPIPVPIDPSRRERFHSYPIRPEIKTNQVTPNTQHRFNYSLRG